MAKKRKTRKRRVLRKTRAELATELRGKSKSLDYTQAEYRKAVRKLHEAIKELWAERSRFEGSQDSNDALRKTELRLLRDYHELAVDVFEEQKSRNQGQDGAMVYSNLRMSEEEVSDLLPENWKGEL